MDFCIEEWKTGHYVASDLSITDMLKRYTRQKKGLTLLADTTYNRLVDLKEDIWTFGM
jgi:hypothetical protein